MFVNLILTGFENLWIFKCSSMTSECSNSKMSILCKAQLISEDLFDNKKLNTSSSFFIVFMVMLYAGLSFKFIN